jgi:methionine-rich copper-binding protein CopC
MTVVRLRPVRASVGRPLGLLVVAAVMALQALVLAPAASAHDGLVSSSPLANEKLTTAPTKVTLSFAETPLSAGLGVVVKGPDGKSVVAGPPAVDGTDVITPLVTLDASGTYTVSWRVVATDGHPVSGTFTFSVAPAAVIPAEPEASPSNSELLSVAQSPGVDLTPWMVGGSLALLVVIIILGVLGVLARRRPR